MLRLFQKDQKVLLISIEYKFKWRRKSKVTFGQDYNLQPLQLLNKITSLNIQLVIQKRKIGINLLDKFKSKQKRINKMMREQMDYLKIFLLVLMKKLVKL
jgi:hypothetical protein